MQIQKIDEKVMCEGSGWKLFLTRSYVGSNYEKRGLFSCCEWHVTLYGGLPRGLLEYSKDRIIKSTYGIGFHLFVEREDALRYARAWPKSNVVLKIGIANFKKARTADGDIYLAQEMYIPCNSEQLKSISQEEESITDAIYHKG